jgi:hypothetical protein
MLIGNAVVVAVFGIAGGFVKVLARGLVGAGLAFEAGGSRVAVGDAVLGSRGAFFGVAALNVGVAAAGTELQALQVAVSTPATARGRRKFFRNMKTSR